MDYTEEAVGLREGVTEAIPWPVSERLLDIGMRDTFREIYPDPVEHPGLTYGNPDFKEGGFGDRIDYLYAGGPSVTRSSELIGEVGGPDVDREYEPWTSDHRAVLSTFQVTPVELPQTLSLERRLLTEGEELGVLYHAPGSEQSTISILPEGGSAGDALAQRASPASQAGPRSTLRPSTRLATTSSWRARTGPSLNATPSGCVRRSRT